MDRYICERPCPKPLVDDTPEFAFVLARVLCYTRRIMMPLES